MIRTRFSKVIVYKIHCGTNGKDYIGITQNLKHRLIVHWNTIIASKILSRAIKKYGRESFDVTIIDRSSTWEDAYEKERYYIKKYNTRAPNGMNMTDGGEGIFGYNHTEETRKRMSKSHKGKGIGKDNPMYGKKGSWAGKKMPKEMREQLSETVKKQYANGRIVWNKGKKYPQFTGENNSFYGKHHSAETKQRLSKMRTGSKHSEKTKQKMSEARRGSLHPNWGKKFSKELRNKLSEAHKNLPIEKKQGMAVLKEKDVLRIRKEYSTKKYSQTELANLFMVSQVTISSIVLGKTWKHI